MRFLLAVMAASVMAALLAAPASAATGRLLVPGKTATTSSTVAALDFALPPAWQQARGMMEGTPMIGSYELAHHPPGVPTCVVRVTLNALAARKPPIVRRDVVRSAPPSRWVPPLEITRKGNRGGVRWWTGRMEFNAPDGTAAAGAAAVRIPKELAPAGRRWAVVAAYVGYTASDTPTSREACSSFAYYDQRTALRDALASVRIVPRTS